ncbi:hypothetical protein OG723_38795 [Streptomyces sp. NBC_01278]|uniref:hypothetical protein n=1 Tax=Streptomyces sp. NBC_01278 TaxID=2903809 RepID=UPI002E36D05A|nr:hypothetical protein [Streptomyces sp. NBC_01278]
MLEVLHGPTGVSLADWFQSSSQFRHTEVATFCQWTVFADADADAVVDIVIGSAAAASATVAARPRTFFTSITVFLFLK